MTVLGTLAEEYRNASYMVEVQGDPDNYKHYTCNYDELIDWFGSYEMVQKIPIDGIKNMYFIKVKSKI
jgi:hypothetical protein